MSNCEKVESRNTLNARGIEKIFLISLFFFDYFRQTKIMVEIRIPVKPFVKHYLTHRYGPEHKLSFRKFIGMLICGVLEKKSIKPSRDLHTDSYYTIIVPEDYYKRYGFEIGHNKKKRIGQLFELLFYEDAFNYVDTEISKGCDAYPSLLFFLKRHNISEFDLKMESVYRKYQRECGNNINAKKNNN